MSGRTDWRCRDPLLTMDNGHRYFPSCNQLNQRPNENTEKKTVLFRSAPALPSLDQRSERSLLAIETAGSARGLCSPGLQPSSIAQACFKPPF